MSQRTPAASTLPLEIPLSRLAEFWIPRDLCQIFRKGTTFQQFQLGSQRIFYVRDIAEREHNIPISINGLVRVFDCPRNFVQSACVHGLDPPEERVKHLALDTVRERPILDWIQQKAEQSTPIGKTEIKDYCTTRLKLPITRGSVNSFVRRHSDQIFKTKSTHQEQERLQVLRMFLERTEQSRI
jgi:hypothetical protein